MGGKYLNANGQWARAANGANYNDTSFSGEKPNPYADNVTVSSFTGTFSAYGGTVRSRLLHYNPDGTLYYYGYRTTSAGNAANAGNSGANSYARVADMDTPASTVSENNKNGTTYGGAAGWALRVYGVKSIGWRNFGTTYGTRSGALI